MSNELGRRAIDEYGDCDPTESVLRKPGYVTRHTGDFFDFETRFRQHVNSVFRDGWAARKRLTAGLLDVISDERNMAIAWCHVRDHGGRAAGSDGITFDMYDPVDLPWAELREWRDEIRGGEYTPDPDRVCLIPKGGDRGNRQIAVLTIRDRVVNRAVLQVLQTVLDRFFDPFSFGCRPSPRTLSALRRGPLPAIATGTALFDCGYTHWVAEDLKDAFGRVPLAGMMDVLGKYLGVAQPNDHKLTRFLGRLLSGASGTGLRQGSPLSAFFINCYLDHHLDRVWRTRHGSWPLVRYVDDILVACRTRQDANQAHAVLTELLRPKGMITKYGRVRSVRALDIRRPVGWLGFNFHRTQTGNLRVRLGNGAWEGLEVSLTEPGLTPDHIPDRMADWLNANAPAYEHSNRRVVYDRLAEMADRWGVSDLADRSQFLTYWQTCHARWHKLQNHTLTALFGQRIPPFNRHEVAAGERGSCVSTRS